MADPIYQGIEDALVAAADAMTTGTGYRYNYNNINQAVPASQTFPNLMIEFISQVGEDVDDNVVDSYTQNAVVRFVATVDNTEEVNLSLDKVEEDLKRLMESSHPTLQAAGMLVADYIDSEKEYTLVRARPGKITVNFNIKYRVKRSDPALST